MIESFCDMINKSALLHKRIMTRVLQKYELTYAQFQVLKTIQDHPGLSAKEVLIYLDTDKATLSGILHRLEKSVMIHRKIDPNDRRLMHLHLTHKSEAIINAVKEQEETCEKKLTKGLKNREIRIFQDAFQTIINNQNEQLKERIKEWEETFNE